MRTPWASSQVADRAGRSLISVNSAISLGEGGSGFCPLLVSLVAIRAALSVGFKRSIMATVSENSMCSDRDLFVLGFKYWYILTASRRSGIGGCSCLRGFLRGVFWGEAACSVFESCFDAICEDAMGVITSCGQSR